jgi:hypothetical protein
MIIIMFTFSILGTGYKKLNLLILTSVRQITIKTQIPAYAHGFGYVGEF